jgi:hypothetical protein
MLASEGVGDGSVERGGFFERQSLAISSVALWVLGGGIDVLCSGGRVKVGGRAVVCTCLLVYSCIPQLVYPTMCVYKASSESWYADVIFYILLTLSGTPTPRGMSSGDVIVTVVHALVHWWCGWW